MPAESKQQQKAAAMALAAKRGEIDPGSLYGAAKQMYNSMSAKQLRHFAKTKRKGLPRKKNEWFVTFSEWLKRRNEVSSGPIYGPDDTAIPPQGTDKNDIVQKVIFDLERLAQNNQWPVNPSVLQDISDRLRNVGIQPVDIDAAIGTTDPDLQKRYLITGPSAPGGGGHGALNDLQKMI